jgi:transposase
VPALPSSILEPLWVQVAVLLPTRQVHHPLGCHRRRIPDRVVFDKLVQVLVFGCGYRRVADQTCSATTLRRRRDEWVTLGVAERLRLAVLGAYQRLFGLELEAPFRGRVHHQGALRRPGCRPRPGRPSQARAETLHGHRGRRHTVGHRGSPGPSSRRWLLAATLDAVAAVGVLPARPVVHLDAGYDYQPCRQALAARGIVGEIATRGVPARSRRADAGRWSAPTRGATSTASCAGAPNAAARWWRSGWRWPTPPSSAADWSVVPGPATAGRPAPPPPMTYWRRL